MAPRLEAVLAMENLSKEYLSRMTQNEFWDYLEQLVRDCPVILDRPKGSPHPRYPQMIYPVDYGYLEGTRTADGGGIDVWVGSTADRPLNGLFLTVDLLKQETEIKLLLGCSLAEKDTILDFLNDGSMRACWLPRDGVELLYTRRSVRRFQDRPVPSATIERLLEVATWAPSAHNRQPWRFAVLTSHTAKARLAQSMGADFWRDLLADGLNQAEATAQVERSRQRIEQAPVVVILCLDRLAGDLYADERRQQAEYIMGTQGVAMAGQNLLLAAQAAGLGGVWMCAPLFAQAAVRQALELPESWLPQGLALLGFPAKEPPVRPRRPLREVTRFL